jgi:hypothetical protein
LWWVWATWMRFWGLRIGAPGQHLIPCSVTIKRSDNF